MVESRSSGVASLILVQGTARQRLDLSANHHIPSISRVSSILVSSFNLLCSFNPVQSMIGSSETVFGNQRHGTKERKNAANNSSLPSANPKKGELEVDVENG